MVSHLGSIDDQSIFEVANGIRYQGIFEAISTLDCSDDSCDYLHSYLHRDDDVVSGTQRDKEYVSVYTLTQPPTAAVRQVQNQMAPIEEIHRVGKSQLSSQ